MNNIFIGRACVSSLRLFLSSFFKTKKNPYSRLSNTFPLGIVSHVYVHKNSSTALYSTTTVVVPGSYNTINVPSKRKNPYSRLGNAFPRHPISCMYTQNSTTVLLLYNRLQIKCDDLLFFIEQRLQVSLFAFETRATSILVSLAPPEAWGT